MTDALTNRKTVTGEDLRTIRALAAEGRSDSEIAAALGCGRSTVTSRRIEMGVPAGNLRAESGRSGVVRAVEVLQTAEVAVILGSDTPVCICGCGKTPPPGRRAATNACAARVGNQRRAAVHTSDDATLLHCNFGLADCLAAYQRRAERHPALMDQELFDESERWLQRNRDRSIADMED